MSTVTGKLEQNMSKYMEEGMEWLQGEWEIKLVSSLEGLIVIHEGKWMMGGMRIVINFKYN